MKYNFFFIINKLNYSGACLQALHLINNLKNKNIKICTAKSTKFEIYKKEVK
jgi:hypothetical protein